jgi:hypothetical protein
LSSATRRGAEPRLVADALKRRDQRPATVLSLARLSDDGSVSEYCHFNNDFEAGLYVHLYPSKRTSRKLPQDRAALYTDYGVVLLEQRDADGLEDVVGGIRRGVLAC